MSYMRRPRTRRSATPIGDLLYDVTGGEPMPTWNRNRGRLAWGQTRVIGGEWDYIRSLPIRTRRRLTGAGFMAKDCMTPDDFADLIRRNVPHLANLGDTNCHAWYVQHALMALAERQRTEHHDRHLAYAQSRGAPSYYSLRNSEAFLDGYDSLWHKRKALGWT
jgi:hypothetical protein